MMLMLSHLLALLFSMLLPTLYMLWNYRKSVTLEVAYFVALFLVNFPLMYINANKMPSGVGLKLTLYSYIFTAYVYSYVYSMPCLIIKGIQLVH